MGFLASVSIQGFSFAIGLIIYSIEIIKYNPNFNESNKGFINILTQ